MVIITGKPASWGKISGRIKIINSYADIFKIEDGDIAVSARLHPDMSLVFMKAKGIITEEESILQHAAIVAREYGIPCIVGVKKATSVFKNNEKVCMDADSGKIEREA
jgi:pyruvate,water dikinase